MISNPQKFCWKIKTSLESTGLFSKNGQEGNRLWRISPEPFYLSPQETEFFSGLGHHLLKFYQALNRLYGASRKGKIPHWFAEYLDLGKPSDLTDYAMMNRFKSHLPGILRPDVIVTEDGFSVTELDSVPGGFGNLCHMMDAYGGVENQIIGSADGGIAVHFWNMLEEGIGRSKFNLALVVSEEAADYLPEMNHIINNLKNKGFSAYLTRPQELLFQETGLFLKGSAGPVKIDVIYRFFELFDLKNIPKAELLMYSAKKGQVKITPPFKPFLEEKLIFALFRHPALSSIWEKELGSETFEALAHLIPSTWILDPRKLPPQSVIPGLSIQGIPIREWQELYELTKKDREMVIKVSGFDPKSWGSRGVIVGHDVSRDEWKSSIEEGLAHFQKRPSILQVFHKGKRHRMPFYNFKTDSLETMDSRVRLTPYYFVVGGEAKMGGILATLCHKDKKKIHGMMDAIMVPCALKP